MHRPITITLTLLTLTAAWPAIGQTGGQEARDADRPELAQAAQDALLQLKAQAPRAVPGNGTPPSTYLDEHVLSRSPSTSDHVLSVFREAENATGDQARARVLEAEASLLGLAAANTLAPAAEGNLTVAHDWLQVLLERVHADARDLPHEDLLDGEAVDQEALEATVHAALAIRAREAVTEALLMNWTGQPEASTATARGAEALLGLLVPEASQRLPDRMRRSFEGNITGVEAAVLAVPAESSGHYLSGLLAPLTALELDRVIEPLNEFAMRNVDPAFVAARAAQEDPAIAESLAKAAVQRYTSDRGRLLLMGEGTMAGVDRAYHALANTTAGGNMSETLDLASQVLEALRPVGLLERGSVLKVETGGVQPGRIHDYRVTLVYPPLEGISRYSIQIESDPAVVGIVGVKPLVDGRFEQNLEADGVVFSSQLDDPLRHSARIAHLKLNATGPPEASTDLTILDATFVEPDGDDVPFFRLRDGHATVANIRAEPDDPGGTANASGISSTPLPPALVVAVLALGAAVAGRRRP